MQYLYNFFGEKKRIFFREKEADSREIAGGIFFQSSRACGFGPGRRVLKPGRDIRNGFFLE